MKELDPLVFVAVLQEMLGLLFWPLAVFIVVGAAALIAVLVTERGLKSRRLVQAEVAGVFGGFLAIGLMLYVTASRPGDILGGPIDWLLTLAIWSAGAIGMTMATYVLLSAIALRNGRAAGAGIPGADRDGRLLTPPDGADKIVSA